MHFYTSFHQTTIHSHNDDLFSIASYLSTCLIVIINELTNYGLINYECINTLFDLICLLLCPPPVHMHGRPLCSADVHSFFSYYETTSSDVIERNSTELRRVFENKSDLKIHVQNVELNSEQPPIFGWFYEDIDRDLSENMFGSRLGNS